MVAPRRRKWERWTPEQDRLLLEFAAQHPDWPPGRVCREFARATGYLFWGVRHRWYQLHGGRGNGNGRGGEASAAGDAGFPVEPSGIKAALLELARTPGRDGRLNARELEAVAERFGVGYATVLALWGQMWAAGDVVFPTRDELAAELKAAKDRIAELEAEVASLRAELEEAREAKRRLEVILAELRRLAA